MMNGLVSDVPESQIAISPVERNGVSGGRLRRILIFTSYYLPGLKSGGPLRSLLHMQESLSAEYEFRVVTRNRDLGSEKAYADTSSETWCTVQSAKVWYLPQPHWSPKPVLKAVESAHPDLIYLQSAVDPLVALLPLLLRWVGLISKRIPVLVAPRGEFSAGALSIKPAKKALYLRLARALGLFDGVRWHATSIEEKNEIIGLWGNATAVAVAPNLASRGPAITDLQRRPKRAGAVRLVFLSRISRKKNLHGALEVLRGIRCRVELSIYGNREDQKYWAECSRLIDLLPENVVAEYKGSVEPDQVVRVLSNYDVFLLPTLGENFGHVICEALVAGCPVILSDKTPWRNLEEDQIGFDISLNQIDRFRSVIDRFAMMDAADFEKWSANARRYGVRIADDPERIRCTREMLSEAIKT